MRLSLVAMLVGGLLCAGCTAAKMNAVEIGMTKAEVLRVMGKPDSVAADSSCEYLKYSLFPSAWEGPMEVYFVRLVDGKVEAFGKAGDFETTIPPTRKYIIEQR